MNPRNTSRSRPGKTVSRSGGITAIGITVAATIAAGTFGVLTTSSMMRSSSWLESSSLVDPPTASEIKSALARTGLDPDALAAAGVAAESVSGVVSRVRTYLADHIQDLRDADAAYISARQSVDSLERAVTGGSTGQVDALATARGQLASAASSRQATLDAVYSAATTGLSGNQTTALTAIKAGRAGRWGLPIEFLAVTRSEPNAVALRNALANARVSAQLGRDPDSGDQQLITTARADSTVSAAKTALDSSRESVTTAWMTAVGQ